VSRTLLIGDVHGCATELNRLVESVAPSDVVLVGDLFTKGPDPAGVWQAIRSWGAGAVLGNQDVRLLDAVNNPAPNAELRACIAGLDGADRSWRSWLEQRPLFLEVAGFTVVHAGIHPSGDLEKTTREMALNMRGYPMSEPGADRWHEQYVGERRVVFGHDARRGLVRHRRDRQTWVLGLDTGCVYGGLLTGYIVEEDRLVQVQAETTYRPV
jgi:hypothetical protein